MKKLNLILCLLATALVVSAMPAKRGVFTVQQPDGTSLEVSLRGDEHAHIYTTPAGLPMVEKNGYYNAAVFDQAGDLKDTGVRADSPAAKQAWSSMDQSALSSLISKHLTKKSLTSPISKSVSKANGPRRVIDKDCRGLFPGTRYPSKGTQKGLVILIEFADLSFKLDDPYDYFNSMLNEDNFSQQGGTGSAAQYFRENSQGLFTPQFDVFGPVKLSKKSAYYADRSGVEKVYEAVIEACQTLDQETDIDFSQYDRDGDGEIDNVYLFYAGKGQNAGGGSWSIWPHSWYVTDATDTKYYFDSVLLNTYACSNELIDSTYPDGVGTFVHEFSHVLGLPDLYNTGYGSSFTPDEFSVLDYGPYNNDCRTPPCYSTFERFALDWIEPVELDSPASLTMNPINSENPQTFIVTTETDNEFFLFENRQQTGWDTYLPGHGMLVWHVAYDAKVWSDNEVNNDGNKQLVDLVEADNMRSDGSRAGDPFPGTTNKTSFTDSTTPNMKSWAKQAQNRPITDIKEEDGIISFDVMGGGERLAAPEIVGTKDIGANHATIEWKPVEGAASYLASVFTMHGSTREYLSNYNNCKVSETSLTLEGLTPETDYSWTVKAADSYGTQSDESTVVKFTTEPMGIEDYVPTALTASEVGYDYFVAAWEPIEVPATEVEVNVYTKQYDSDPVADTEDFANGWQKLNDGWTTSCTQLSETEGYYGNAAPALRISSPGQHITTPEYADPILSISFWQRNMPEGNDALLTLYALCYGEWVDIVDFEPSENGAVIEYTDIPAEATALSIAATAEKGCDIAIDDVCVMVQHDGTYVPFASPFTTTASNNSLKVSGLQPSTNYYYTVMAKDGSDCSKVSQYVRATTRTKDSGICAPVKDDTAVSGTPVWYNLQGARILNPERGQIYIRVVGTKADKVRY